MNWFKRYVADFPTQGGTVVVALFLITGMGVIVIGRLLMGKPFPDGYDSWLVFLGALAGVSTIGMIGKRATDYEYAKAQNPATVTTTTTAAPDGSTTVTATHPVVEPEPEDHGK